MLQYQVIPVTSFQQNCTLFWCDSTMKGAIIDPGGDAQQIIAAVKNIGIHVTQVLLTHGHLDHVGAASEIAAHFSVDIIGPHKDDAYWLELLPEQSEQFGFNYVASFTPKRWLNEGDVISLGNETLQVFHCPGHTPGHVIFFSQSAQLAQVGDVLFAGSIGRTDFPGGNHQALLDSIKNKLWPLGDGVTFIPGHGPLSTFAIERRSNPFVGDLR
jgi:hydroxyacylglutathione hydrolase